MISSYFYPYNQPNNLGHISAEDKKQVIIYSIMDNNDIVSVLTSENNQKVVQLNAEEFLFTAVEFSNLKAIEILLDMGADINCKNPEGKPLLLMALERRLFNIFIFLLERGADVNYVGQNGWTALMVAAMHSSHLITVIRDAGADVNYVGQNGWTALILATRYNPDWIPVLINAGADVNHADENGWTSLMVAARNHPDWIQVLLDAGADVNHTDKNGLTALMIATQYEPNGIQALLDAGADVNNIDREGWTPLTLAVMYHPDLILTLLNAGANVNHPLQGGWTALMIAAQDRPDLIPTLLNAGASVNDVSAEGLTAVMIAAQYNPDSVFDLIEAGADVNYVEEEAGCTLLTIIAGSSPNHISRIIDAGANVHHVQDDGLGVLLSVEKTHPEALTRSLMREIFSRCESILLTNFFYLPSESQTLKRVKVYGYENEKEWKCRVETEDLWSRETDVEEGSLQAVYNKLGGDDLDIARMREYLKWSAPSPSDDGQIAMIKKILYFSLIKFPFGTEVLNRVWIQDVVEHTYSGHRQFNRLKALAKSQTTRQKQAETLFKRLKNSFLYDREGMAAYFFKVASYINDNKLTRIGFKKFENEKMRNESIIDAIGYLSRREVAREVNEDRSKIRRIDI